MKNIILITVDSLRADYVFGSKAPESLKTLPQLAAEGITFPNAFSNAAYTKASFLSVLSGTYPWMFDSVPGGFDPERPHIAELLSEAGYATGGFQTNTYLGPTYNYDRGFDYYLGRQTTGDNGHGGVSAVYSNLLGRAISIPGLSDAIHGVYSAVGKRLGVQLGSHLYKPAEELNDAVVHWTRTRSQPVFVWVHYMDVHNPYYPHDGTASEGIPRRRAVKLFHRANELRADTPEEDLATLERLYRGEIEYLDRELGDLLQRLDETIGLDETLVAFTSDHGEAFDERGHVFHPGGVLYDEHVHVPLLLSGPDVGRGTVRTPVSNADLAPTLLSAAGIEPPRQMVGEDVTDFLDRPPEKRYVYAEAFGREDGHAMVTDGTYQLIRHLETGEEELYDRRENPRNAREYARALPATHEELSTALDEHVQSVRDTHHGAQDIEVPEAVRLRLRKLGYDE